MSAVLRAPIAEPEHQPLLAGRYHLEERTAHRCGVTRYLASDESTSPPTPVQLVRTALPKGDELPAPGDGSMWPSLAWEEQLRTRCPHAGLPRVLERFTTERSTYLVLEMPTGVTLWDAWDETSRSATERFGWLIQLAELMRALHAAGAILEGLRPDQIRVSTDGQIMLADTGALLPLPLPADAPVIGTFATAPELLTGAWIDARADLYCFGAMVYALVLGRELADVDFIAANQPKPFLERFPDAHPLLGRLICKTFCPEVERRFPTVFAMTSDPTGFKELIATLEQCQRTFDRVRLEVASWSNTGMTRSSNEDAYSIYHASTGRCDDLEDHALVVVADGMGGNAAGEVAAALAVRELTRLLSAQPPFRVGPEPESIEAPKPDNIRNSIASALKQTNRTVNLASRQAIGRRGMGCTAEVVYTNGRRLIIGHIGDSRTYRFHRGRLTLLTRDQTMVSRLLEFGEITAEEAEKHPRRSELQQAIGGWAEVNPDMIDVALEPGDWVLVCTDGLSNVVKPQALRDVLEAATSADAAARRLVNLANLGGAPDNATAVVIRAI